MSNQTAESRAAALAERGLYPVIEYDRLGNAVTMHVCDAWTVIDFNDLTARLCGEVTTQVFLDTGQN